LGTCQVQNAAMKTSVILDDELFGEVEKTVSLVGENQATILRMAIRAGLPVVASAFQPPRPEGYFADDYRRPDPEREKLEAAMLKVPQKPER
jgi:hypothetical protein